MKEKKKKIPRFVHRFDRSSFRSLYVCVWRVVEEGGSLHAYIQNTIDNTQYTIHSVHCRIPNAFLRSCFFTYFLLLILSYFCLSWFYSRTTGSEPRPAPAAAMQCNADTNANINMNMNVPSRNTCVH